MTEITNHPNSGRNNGKAVKFVRIADLLNYGENAAIPLQHLIRLTNWDARKIRIQIMTERRTGSLILSDNQHGYYLAETPAEVKRFVTSMRCRANEILETAASVERAAKKVYAEQPTEGVGD